MLHWRISLALLLVACSLSTASSNGSAECETAACREAAAFFKRAVDFSVDPCQDFYEFSCGKLIAELRNVSRDGHDPASSFEESQQKTDRDLKSLLEEQANNSDPNANRYQTYWKSCMDVESINKHSFATLSRLLRDVGGSPALGEKSGWFPGRKFNWLTQTVKLRKLGIGHNILLRVVVTSNPLNQSQSLISLAEPTMSLLDRFLTGALPDSESNWYRKSLTDLLLELGATKVDLKRAIESSAKFANQLYDAKEQMENQGQIKLMPLAIIAAFAREEAFVDSIIDIVGSQVDPNDDIMLINQSYILYILGLLKRTDSDLLADYMMLRTVNNLLYSLTAVDTKELPRAQVCKQDIYENLGISLSSAYMKRFVAVETHQKGLEMVSLIREAVKGVIGRADWISAETKSEASTKAGAIKANVAYIGEMLDDNSVEQYYGDIQFESDRYLENTLKLRRQTLDVAYSLLEGSQHIKDWQLFSRAIQVNAFYYPMANSINIMPSIMQGRFFNASRPAYLNFGSLGAVIGHEILHAFDNTGARYDKDGNYRVWWDADTAKGFAARAECLVEQYDGKIIEGTNVTVDGKKTLGENIADNGGYEVSLRAYRDWVQTNEPELPLPGLELSLEQLFWVSAATNWCSALPAEKIAMISRSDIHSPGKFRANYPMRNLKDFAEAFKCAPGSPMNPTHKCELW